MSEKQKWKEKWKSMLSDIGTSQTEIAEILGYASVDSLYACISKSPKFPMTLKRVIKFYELAKTNSETEMETEMETE